MAGRRSTYALHDLIGLGRNASVDGGPQLPMPPMLMFDTISAIADTGGAYGKGQVVASLSPNPALDWIGASHFRGGPVMPGTLELEAMWQLTGFFLGWLGHSGRARALGVEQARFTGMPVPKCAPLEYVVDIKRVVLRRFKLCIADGLVTVDGQVIYTATNLRVGLF